MDAAGVALGGRPGPVGRQGEQLGRPGQLPPPVLDELLPLGGGHTVGELGGGHGPPSLSGTGGAVGLTE
ncbi:hypothetical protein QNO07_21000 [Streptomyces sp. 549]|uniref:hypothetical protein n=1 Tax=Streptomyces sp. 549 TaxID=3049076 RepID=UPI0024C28696|nr:hypothetical protein [Streptomyces sp. 549]MDK1475863.1 hypothetical protein [Streptomyces sp. 549]